MNGELLRRALSGFAGRRMVSTMRAIKNRTCPKFLMTCLVVVCAAGCGEMDDDSLRSVLQGSPKVRIEWRHKKTGERLVMEIPRECIKRIAKKDSDGKVDSNGPGIIRLITNYSTGPAAKRSDRECPPVSLPKTLEIMNGWRFVIVLRPFFLEQSDQAWRLDVVRRGLVVADQDKSDGYYLSETVAPDLLHYKYKVCGLTDLDALPIPLPAGVFQKHDGRRTKFENDTAPNGCIDSDRKEDVYSSRPETPPEKYSWMNVSPSQPGAPYSCWVISSYRGWNLDYLCFKESILHDAVLRQSVREWLDGFRIN